MLQAGADPQAVDRAKNTPLHLIVTYTKIVSDFLTLHAIVMALLEAGAHIDSVNSAGQTPLDASTTGQSTLFMKTVSKRDKTSLFVAGVAEIILKSQADISLKCLAAQSVRKYNINYIGQVHHTHIHIGTVSICRSPKHSSRSFTFMEHSLTFSDIFVYFK